MLKATFLLMRVDQFMMFRTPSWRSVPIIARDALQSALSLPLRNKDAPLILNSTFKPGCEIELALQENERRVKRQEKLFEGMMVFQGGALQDYSSLGKKMLMRDFVHYSLYHHKWGYHPKLQRKYRELMTVGFFDPIPFGNLRSQYDYEEYVARMSDSTPTFPTPASIFQPFYGWTLAEYMVTTMRAKFHPSEPLIIYDIGAGAGNLAVSVLDFLAEQFPDVYETCEYHLVEMSAYCIPIQRKKLINHMNHVHIHHISIHNWRKLEPRRCFVMAIELFSNMPHDYITWTQDGTAYEQWVIFAETDNLSSVEEKLYQLTDPIILRYLRYCHWMHEESFNNLRVLCLTDGQNTIQPPRWKALEPNIYDSMLHVLVKSWAVHNPFRIAWMPIGQMVMLEVMAEFFPRHHALFADWNSVQHAIMGIDGPLVQSKVRVAKDVFIRRTTDHFMMNAGMVDICFPTDFDRLSDVYRSVCGDHKEVMHMTHPDFWKSHGGEKTALFATQNGWNPMIEDFAMFSVFATNHPAEM